MHGIVLLLKEALKLDAILVMINTVFFDAMWQYLYGDGKVRKRDFYNADQTAQSRYCMAAKTDFVENGLATEFMKNSLFVA